MKSRVRPDMVVGIPMGTPVGVVIEQAPLACRSPLDFGPSIFRIMVIRTNTARTRPLHR
jgi:hypothetical protein